MKRNYLLASLLAIAVMFTGCSQDDETIGTNPLQTYKGEVNASLEDVLGDSGIEGPGTRAMFIGGNSGNRFANVWDTGDKILVYKDGVKVSTTPWSLDDEANEAYQGTKEAYFSGELEGSFAVGDQVQLYVTQGTDLARSYTGQDGTIGKLSKDYSFRNATVSVSKITGTTIKLSRAAMWHSQAYLRFFLKDENNQRLHLQKLVISSTGDNKIVTKVAANGTETTGDIEVNTAEYRGEYPGEIYVAILNQGYTVDAETGAVTNGSVGAYQLTAVDDKGTVYVFPGPGETQNAIKVNPTIGSLTNIERKLSKGTPEITMASQKKMIVGTTSTRTPADVKIGAASIKDNATITYSSSNTTVASVNPTTGEVTANEAGTAVITATVAATDDYSSVNASYTLTVEELTAQAVDLGLPSGIKWASMNVGAESETDYGTYFAWGETEGWTSEYDYDKDNFILTTYKWCNGSLTTNTKYVTSDKASSYGYNGFYDDKTKLDPEDDAATQNWGSDWCMPTETQIRELIDNTDREWAIINGINICKLMKKTDHDIYIIIPADGNRVGLTFEDLGSLCHCWSSTLYTENQAQGRYLDISSNYALASVRNRFVGRTVRAVYVGN